MSAADGLEVQLDKGLTVQLTNEQARHIEYGYAADSLKTGAPERILISRDGSLQAAPDVASLSRTGREVSVYPSDGSVQTNAQNPSIALAEELKPSIELPEQQQSEAPANVIAPEQGPAIHHRHSHGR